MVCRRAFLARACFRAAEPLRVQVLTPELDDRWRRARNPVQHVLVRACQQEFRSQTLFPGQVAAARRADYARTVHTSSRSESMVGAEIPSTRRQDLSYFSVVKAIVTTSFAIAGAAYCLRGILQTLNQPGNMSTANSTGISSADVFEVASDA